MASPPTTSTLDNNRPIASLNTTQKTAVKRGDTDSLHKFIKRELELWQADLRKRRQEGKHLLEWLNWSTPDTTETSGYQHLQQLQQLIKKEIPYLSKLIYRVSAGNEDLDEDQLLVVQQAYDDCCGRFDKIRMELLEQMNWGSQFRIY